MNRSKVVMARRLRPSAQQLLAEKCELLIWEDSRPMPYELLAEWLREAEGFVSAPDVTVDGRLLSYAPKLRVIAQSSVGYDNINIPDCTNRKIPVGHTPGVLVEATADLAFGIFLCAARRIHEGWEFVRQGLWEPGSNIPFGIDLYGKTMGIAGMGRIGAAVARRAQAFGMQVIYYNRCRRDDEAELNARYVSFAELLEQSDCVLVLMPLSAETRGLFGHDQFAKMKSTAFFVNAARGTIVDTPALVEALTQNRIAYAALDVTDPEPLPADHPLLRLPNVLITPHIGSATAETRDRMAMLTVENLLAGLAGRRLPACVNSEVNFK